MKDSINPTQILGAIIKRKRTQMNMSQETLALNAQIDRSYLSEVERGIKHPTFPKVLAICEGLEMQISELIFLFEEDYYKLK